MKTMTRRICALERSLGSQRKPGLRFVITAAGCSMALDSAACLKILEECGYLRESDAVSVASLIEIPEGLDMKEMERFLRERGAEICSPRRSEC